MKEKKLPAGFVPEASIAAAIQACSQEEKMTCAQAFIIAEQADVAPLTVGLNADALGIHLDHCQLGLFGYPGHTKGWDVANIAAYPVPEGLEAAIRSALDDEGRLACVRAWEIAAQFAIPKMLVGYIATQWGIRIVLCQLGAF
ncbi:MAG TPA: hypothetical protein PLH19_14275 [Anaerolineae bacterium]|nr:hypothetical protein [Anaerolineae bacterium]HQH39683.1 hypothetical protein [Anaerolineae bacterium]